MATVSLVALRRRQGAIKASITKFATKVDDLEAKELSPSVHVHAQQLSKHLENLDSNFKTRHFAVIDALEDDEQVDAEQEILDKHDEEVADITSSPDGSCCYHSTYSTYRPYSSQSCYPREAVGATTSTSGVCTRKDW